MRSFRLLVFAFPLLAFLVAQPSASALVAQEEDLAFEVGTEGYVYAFPMMMIEKTRRVSTNVDAPISVFSPIAARNQKRQPRFTWKPLRSMSISGGIPVPASVSGVGPATVADRSR